MKKRIQKALLSSDINKKIFNHGFWILAGNGLSKFILLGITILMAKFLDKEVYGQFGIIKSTIIMFSVFAGLELGLTATRYISSYRLTASDRVRKIVGLSNFFSIIISIIISLFIYIYAQEISAKIKTPHLYKEIRLTAMILFFSSLNGIQSGVLSGLERFKVLSINTTIASIISSIAMLLASVYYNFFAIVLAFGSNYIILFILNFFSLKGFYKEYKINIFRKDNFDELKVLWEFSLPAILGGLMVAPVTWYVNYMLANQVDGYQHVAVFDVANQWKNTILFIPAALSQIALPLLSSNLDNATQYRSVYIKNIKINLYITIALILVLTALSPILLSLYGDKYQDALLPMIIMFVVTCFMSVNNVIGQAIASKNKMWIGFYVNFLWAFVLILSSYILIEKLHCGAIGASWAYLIAYMMHTVVQFLYINKKI